MAAEAALWKLIRSSHPPGHWVRVENRVERGTPDVSFCLNGMAGWLELKSLGTLPVDPELPFRIRHFTKQQRFWIRRRVKAGGRVALLLRVERPREYLLLPGLWAAERVGEATAEEARREALAAWSPAWNLGALLEGLAKMR